MAGWRILCISSTNLVIVGRNLDSCSPELAHDFIIPTLCSVRPITATKLKCGSDSISRLGKTSSMRKEQPVMRSSLVWSSAGFLCENVIGNQMSVLVIRKLCFVLRTGKQMLFTSASLTKNRFTPRPTLANRFPNTRLLGHQQKAAPIMY